MEFLEVGVAQVNVQVVVPNDSVAVALVVVATVPSML